MHTSNSHNGISIRLSSERWEHISQNHPELGGYLHDVLDTVCHPDELREGSAGEMLAIKAVEDGKFLIVVYRELSVDDGFVITAFLSRRMNWLAKRREVWL